MMPFPCSNHCEILGISFTTYIHDSLRFWFDSIRAFMVITSGDRPKGPDDRLEGGGKLGMMPFPCSNRSGILHTSFTTYIHESLRFWFNSIHAFMVKIHYDHGPEAGAKRGERSTSNRDVIFQCSRDAIDLNFSPAHKLHTLSNPCNFQSICYIPS